MEKILQTKTCKHCNTSFDILEKDVEFYDKLSPVIVGKKYPLPTPSFCPACRQQRMLSFRNERSLYRRPSNIPGQEIISMYSPDKKYTVYQQDYRWNSFDAIHFSLTFDFSLSAFENFFELTKRVPKRALIKGTSVENTEYGNGIGGCKDCYLIFATSEAQNCYYAQGANFSHDCVDCLDLMKCENCYEVVGGNNCYACFFSRDIIDCRESYYLYNCTNCQNCFGCVNLSNKKYHIFNEEFSQDEYFKKLPELLKDFSREKFLAYQQEFSHKALNIVQSENALGDDIKGSKDVYNSFDIQDSQNVRYSCHIYGKGEDIMDTYTGLNGSTRLLESSVINKTSSNIIYSHDCWSHCENLMYCSECKTCKDCFLCHGLVSKQYCILNKQYSREEYEKLVPEIISHMQKSGEWGEFFPSYISPFGYNETAAQEYFPMTREEVLSSVIPAKAGISGTEIQDKTTLKGYSSQAGVGQKVETFLQGPVFNWSDYEAPFPKVEKIIPASKLPTSISDIPDDILNWAIQCEVTSKPFRIIKQELEFYRKHTLPIPRRHPEQRHKERLHQRNPRKIFQRSCDKCKKEIQTTFSPERKEKVYCQNCYDKEIY